MVVRSLCYKRFMCSLVWWHCGATCARHYVDHWDNLALAGHTACDLVLGSIKEFYTIGELCRGIQISHGMVSSYFFLNQVGLRMPVVGGS